MEYSTEKFSDVIEEAKPLLEKHWEEIALDRDTIKLNPDYEKYQALEDIGLIHITTAREGGVLIGYSAYFITPNLHYKQVIVAESDIFYISPEYRRGTTALKLFKAAEKALSELGVHKVVSKIKTDHDKGPLFERMGYRAIEVNYCKTLNKVGGLDHLEGETVQVLGDEVGPV